MKNAFLLYFLFCSSLLSFGRTYYFSSLQGDDSRSATQAQNPATPWRSLSKLNSFFSSIQPGDSVLFRRGDVFYGALDISRSGSSSAPIVLAAYGSGAKPVISGMTTLSGWTSLGSGVWESYNAGLGSEVNVLLINNEPQRMGRWPAHDAENKGYRTISSYYGSTKITDNSLSSSPSWTGGEVVIRKAHFIWARGKISSHSGTTITYSAEDYNSAKVGWGYFIQNHLQTLYQSKRFGYWYYQASSKEMKAYFGSHTPSSYKIEASTVGTVVTISDESFIKLQDLTIKGANKWGVYIKSSNNISLTGVDVLYSGRDAVYVISSNGVTFRGGAVLHSQNRGFDINESNTNVTIAESEIRNTGNFVGALPTNNYLSYAIKSMGSNVLIKGNRVINSGYTAIFFTGNYTTVQNNLVDSFCTTTGDGGGIYAWNYEDGRLRAGQKILGNIVLNGFDPPEGRTGEMKANGIYLDNRCNNVEVRGNTSAFCKGRGLFINYGNYNHVVTDNTSYDNDFQFRIAATDADQTTKNSIRNNILFSRSVTQYCVYALAPSSTHLGTGTGGFGQFDYNYYCRPADDKIFRTSFDGITKYYDLSLWKSTYSKDLNSAKKPVAFDSSTLRFEYNPTNTAKTISLNTGYVDAKGNHHSGSVEIPAFGSVVLLKDNSTTDKTYTPTVSLTSPTADAAFAAPGSVTLSATASDADGSISKVEFFSGTTLINTQSSAPYTFTWQNVPAGTYLITAKATDNQGLTTTSQAVSISIDAQLNDDIKDPSESQTSLRVNFQDARSKVPYGWLVDFGQSYGLRSSANQGSGNTYGWISRSDKTPLDLTMNGRKRSSPADTLLATLMHLQARGVTEGIWEAKMANGTYDVTVSVGDGVYLDSKHSINIEGMPAIVGFVPTSSIRFKKASVTVTVTDEKLTIDAIGGVNTKLNYIIVKPSSQVSTSAKMTNETKMLSGQVLVESTTADTNPVAGLTIKQLYPNPSSTHFNVAIQASGKDLLKLNIYDYAGRLLESKTGILPNSTIQVGHQLPRGMYILQVSKGSEKAEAKMTKL